MRTDPLFYRLFETSPETLFLVLGKSLEEARALAAQYEFAAVEFKETSHRADGVFRPKEPGLPLYFVEVQFYWLPEVYADLLVKAFTYLKHHDPGQLFYGVVLFGTRSLEPTELGPYQLLLNGGAIKRFFLDELPEALNAPLGMSILGLIPKVEDQAALSARALVARAKLEIQDEALRANLVELIETIILYKLSHLSREEIQAMLRVSDIRETRVYREAKEEGFQEGIEKGVENEKQRIRQRNLASIPKLAAMNLSPEVIADILDLDVELIRAELAKSTP